MILQAFHQTIVLFILIGLGSVAYKTGVITDDRSKGLSSLLLGFITPAVIVNAFCIEYSPDVATDIMISTILSVLGFALNCVLLFLLFRKSGSYDVPLAKFCSMYSNCGYMGMPLVSGLYGPENLYIISPHFAFFNLFAFTHGVNMFSDSKKIDIKKIITPPIIALILGLIIFSFQIKLPSVISEPINMIAQTQTPIAMFIAGVSIAKTDFRNIKHIGGLLKCSAVKLFIAPFIYAVILALIPASYMVKMIALTCMACPTAAISIIFAVQYKRDDIFAAEVFSITTLLSALTIPLMLTWGVFVFSI